MQPDPSTLTSWSAALQGAGPYALVVALGVALAAVCGVVVVLWRELRASERVGRELLMETTKALVGVKQALDAHEKLLDHALSTRRPRGGA